MYRQFNIQQLYVLPTQCIYVFCIYPRTNSDLCHLQHKLIGFYNREEKCLQRGTDWVSNIAVCASSLKGYRTQSIVKIFATVRHMSQPNTFSHPPVPPSSRPPILLPQGTFNFTLFLISNHSWRYPQFSVPHQNPAPLFTLSLTRHILR